MARTKGKKLSRIKNQFDSCQPPKIAFALGGGATHGAFTWGALEVALQELPHDIIAYSGTSAGAINACYAAVGQKKDSRQGAINMLNHCWKNNIAGKGFQSHPMAIWFGYYDLEDNPFYKFYDSFWKDFTHASMGHTRYNPIRTMLEKDIDLNLLRDKASPQVFVNAVQIENREDYIFTDEALTYETITASTSLLRYFDPVVIDGKHYVDGFYKGSNPPVKILQEETDCTDIIIISLNPYKSHHIPKTARQIEKFENEMLASSGLWKDLEQIERRNERIKNGLEDGRVVYVHLIEMVPPAGMGVHSKSNTSPEFLNNLKQMGKAAYREWYKQHGHKIGKESSFYTHDRKGGTLVKKLSLL